MNKKEENEYLEVAIAEIRRDGDKVYYVVSFGGGKEGVIVGREEWEKFLGLVNNIDWHPDDTWIRPIKRKRTFDM